MPLKLTPADAARLGLGVTAPRRRSKGKRGTSALAALFVSTGTSHAGLDNELSLVDGKGRTLTIQQWDTFLNGVYPLDRNRLTREWFHSGRAIYNVAGDGASDFAGTLAPITVRSGASASREIGSSAVRGSKPRFLNM